MYSLKKKIPPSEPKLQQHPWTFFPCSEGQGDFHLRARKHSTAP